MNMWARNKQQGFTIVELLVVIVVLAVLASITVVAYNGIQDRANSAKIESVVKSYKTAIELYYADNDKYPATFNANGDYLCLGKSSDFPADGTFAAGQCSRYGNNTYGAIVMDDFNTKLRPYMPNPPSAVLKTHSWNSSGTTYWVRGVEFEIHDKWAYMEYYIKGNQSCPTGRAQYDSAINMTRCIIEMYGHL